MVHQGVVTIVLMTIAPLCCMAIPTENQQVKKCHAFSGDDANTNLEDAVLLYRNCFILHKENFRHRVPSNTCLETTRQIQGCGGQLAKRIDECSSADARYFPRSALSLVGDYAQHVCANSANYKFLLERKICFPSLEHAIGCFGRFSYFNMTSNVSREEMCNDEMEVRDCLLEYANSTCRKDLLFQKIVNKTFDFNQLPCTYNENAASSVFKFWLCDIISIIFISNFFKYIMIDIKNF